VNNFNFHSFEQQDEFVANIFDQKTNGFFLDIGSGHTLVGSNTIALEKTLDWTGVSFDLFDSKANYQWDLHRSSKFECMDVTSNQFYDYLKNSIPSNLVVDYISLDVDGPRGSDVITALGKIIDSKIKFKSLTLEHEYFLYGDTYRQPTRQMLEDLGFIRLFGDVKAWSIGSRGNGTESFEDWWVHPGYFDTDLIDLKSSNLYSFECIEILKQNRKNLYTCKHRCSNAFPKEYDLFFHDGHRDQQLKIFEQFPR